jgi:hypothetical protein
MEASILYSSSVNLHKACASSLDLTRDNLGKILFDFSETAPLVTLILALVVLRICPDMIMIVLLRLG